MNFRIMTIGGIFSLALGVPVLPLAADAPGPVANPLRAPNRSPLFGNSADRAPAPSAAASVASRTPPSLWRNPGWIQPTEASAETGVDAASGNPPSPMASDAQAAPPSRTLVQRLRDRRIAQLEKQALRLRELSLQDGPPGLDMRGNPYLPGPENPDLQVDLGLPRSGPRFARAYPRPLDPSTSLDDTPLIESPQGPEPLAGMLPTELNSPADPPVDVQIELPGDPVPAQPKPPLQARLRNWWSPTVR